MVAAKIPTKVESLLNRKVRKILISERNHFALGHKQCKLVLSCIAELAELDTSNFGASAWGELLDLGARFQQIWESRICVQAMLDVNELFKRRVFFPMVPYWKVMRVLESY
jgi:hypothetical protein